MYSLRRARQREQRPATIIVVDIVVIFCPIYSYEGSSSPFMSLLPLTTGDNNNNNNNNNNKSKKDQNIVENIGK